MYIFNPVRILISQLNSTGIDADLNLGAFSIYSDDFVGKIVWQSDHATAPFHSLPCDGAAVSRTVTYAKLFAKIGIKYGAGDGATTFNVPSLKGRKLVGFDNGDADYNDVAKTGGTKTHTLTTAELATHTHAGSQPTHTHAGSQGTHTHVGSQPTHTHTVPASAVAGAVLGIFGPAVVNASTVTSNAGGNDAVTVAAGGDDAVTVAAGGNDAVTVAAGGNDAVTNANAGTGSAHENRSPYLVMKAFIYF